MASPSETFESIGSGVFEAGRTLTPLDRDDLARIPHRFERLHAVFPRAQSANGSGEIALTDLRTRPLIVPCSERTHPALRRWLLEQCAKAGFKPNIVEEVPSATASSISSRMEPESQSCLAKRATECRRIFNAAPSPIWSRWR